MPPASIPGLPAVLSAPLAGLPAVVMALAVPPADPVLPRPMSALMPVVPKPFGSVKSTQSVYAFITTIATSVRFFAFNFLMTLRTWTFTVLEHIFKS